MSSKGTTTCSRTRSNTSPGGSPSAARHADNRPASQTAGQKDRMTTISSSKGNLFEEAASELLGRKPIGPTLAPPSAQQAGSQHPSISPNRFASAPQQKSESMRNLNLKVAQDGIAPPALPKRGPSPNSDRKFPGAVKDYSIVKTTSESGTSGIVGQRKGTLERRPTEIGSSVMTNASSSINNHTRANSTSSVKTPIEPLPNKTVNAVHNSLSPNRKATLERRPADLPTNSSNYRATVMERKPIDMQNIQSVPTVTRQGSPLISEESSNSSIKVPQRPSISPRSVSPLRDPHDSPSHHSNKPGESNSLLSPTSDPAVERIASIKNLSINVSDITVVDKPKSPRKDSLEVENGEKKGTSPRMWRQKNPKKKEKDNLLDPNPVARSSGGAKSETFKEFFKKYHKKEGDEGDSPNPEPIVVDTELGAEISAFQNLILNHTEIISTLYEVIPKDKIRDMCESLLSIYMYHKVEHRLLNWSMQKEIKSTVNHTTLFRETSMAAALISIYSMKNCLNYFKDILIPFFELMPLDCALEVDPLKCNPAYIESNRATLSRIVQQLLDDVFQSANQFPGSMKYVFLNLQKLVVSKFPSVKHEIVGGFFFLRFLCPVLVGPDTHGLLQEVTKELRRTLILASKIVQNLSNNVLFTKEEYMKPFNVLIEENQGKMQTFLETLSKPPREGVSRRIEKEPDDGGVEVAEDVLTQSVLCLIKYMKEKKKEVKTMLEEKDAADMIELLDPILKFGVEEKGTKDKEKEKEKEKEKDKDKDKKKGGLFPKATVYRASDRQVKPEKVFGTVNAPNGDASVVSKPADSAIPPGDMIPRSFLISEQLKCRALEEQIEELKRRLEEEESMRKDLQRVLLEMTDNIEAQVQQRLSYEVEIAKQKQRQNR